MRREANSDLSWFEAATLGDVMSRSLKVSLIVGTILIGINHGDALLGVGVSPDMLWKIPLTYLVPYSVSTYASVDAILSS
ncbi:MAG: nitrate/nitrite transporter NrtS [Pseudomonadota bacterium]